MNARPRLFVALEGIDGCGKTTLAAGLTGRLRAAGRIVLITGEHTGGPIGRRIERMLHGAEPMVSPYELQRLFVLDRREHLEHVIEPALEAGIIVFADRFWLSTLAYGMLTRDAETFITVHQEVLGERFRRPDVTLLADIPAETAMERLGNMSRDLTFFEKRDKLEKIRENYLTLAKRPDVGRVEIIDGAMGKDSILGAAAKILVPYLA